MRPEQLGAADRGQTRTPLLAWFLAHGSPMLAIQAAPYTRTLGSLGSNLPALSAIAVISAHWQTPAASG